MRNKVSRPVQVVPDGAQQHLQAGFAQAEGPRLPAAGANEVADDPLGGGADPANLGRRLRLARGLLEIVQQGVSGTGVHLPPALAAATRRVVRAGVADLGREAGLPVPAPPHRVTRRTGERAGGFVEGERRFVEGVHGQGRRWRATSGSAKERCVERCRRPIGILFDSTGKIPWSKNDNFSFAVFQQLPNTPSTPGASSPATPGHLQTAKGGRRR